MTAHTCHAFGCDTRVPPRMFMCRPHWFSLPAEMRDAVTDAYVPGQESNLTLVSAEYRTAARVARVWLRDHPERVLTKTLGQSVDEILCRGETT